MTKECSASLEELLEHFDHYPSGYISEPLEGENAGVYPEEDIQEFFKTVDLKGDEKTESEPYDIKIEVHSGPAKNRTRMILLACHLLSYRLFETDGSLEMFPRKSITIKKILNCLNKGFNELAELLAVEDIGTDKERREEFIRHSLLQLGLHPRGETSEQALERYESISLVVQKREAEEERRKLEEARRSSSRATRD